MRALLAMMTREFGREKTTLPFLAHVFRDLGLDAGGNENIESNYVSKSLLYSVMSVSVGQLVILSGNPRI